MHINADNVTSLDTLQAMMGNQTQPWAVYKEQNLWADWHGPEEVGF